MQLPSIKKSVLYLSLSINFKNKLKFFCLFLLFLLSNFQEISEAYQVLGNTEKRKNYDMYGNSFLEGGNSFVSPKIVLDIDGDFWYNL